jgi:hypothetical protein
MSKTTKTRHAHGHVVYSNANGVVVDTGHGYRNYRVFHAALPDGHYWAYSTFKGAVRSLRSATLAAA